MSNWLALSNPMEVIPLEDLKPHVEATEILGMGQGCWCKPQLIDNVIVHHSMDGREFYERGERKPS